MREVCDLITDGTHYSPKASMLGIPFLTVKDFSNEGPDFDGCIRISEEDFRVADRGNSAPRAGDVLFSKDGTVGKVWAVSDERPFAVLSSIAILRPKPTKLDARFLAHVLKSDFARRQFGGIKTGSALKRVILRDIESLRIPLPSLTEQRRIADILDGADALKRKRRYTFQQVQLALSAIFLDMFGDPVRNSKSFPVAKLGDVSLNITDGKHGDCRPDPESGLYFVSVKDIKDGQIEYERARQICREDFNEVHRRTKLAAGDVLITNSGTIGRTAIADVNMPLDRTVFQKSVALIKPKQDILLPVYLKMFLDLSVRDLLGIASGSGQKNLLLGQLREFQIPMPSVSKQRTFQSAHDRIDEIKRKQYEAQALECQLYSAIQNQLFPGVQ